GRLQGWFVSANIGVEMLPRRRDSSTRSGMVPWPWIARETSTRWSGGSGRAVHPAGRDVALPGPLGGPGLATGIRTRFGVDDRLGRTATDEIGAEMRSGPRRSHRDRGGKTEGSSARFRGTGGISFGTTRSRRVGTRDPDTRLARPSRGGEEEDDAPRRSHVS